ncbi:MAG: hypothetical protein Q7K28_01175 [Candidatus Wildermuthbacteria bacterium]|nr:hypothetical protein [Candidatus Wildermuthbacteria bacterium]
MAENKSIYICGPLTELLPEEQRRVKNFYVKLADVCEEVTGIRAFVPHEHHDPIKHANHTSAQIDLDERTQVCEKTSLVVAVPVASSWGSGIEVEMANQHRVPVIVLCEKVRLEQRKISRLLQGNPAVASMIIYSSEDEAIKKLREELKNRAA